MQHDSVILSARFSPDGRQIVTASKDGTARLWDSATGNPIGEPMQSNEAVCAAEFNRDGNWVATASTWDAQVWNAATGKEAGDRMKHDAAVVSVHFNADAKLVVTACADGAARIWDATTAKLIGKPMCTTRQ